MSAWPVVVSLDSTIFLPLYRFYLIELFLAFISVGKCYVNERLLWDISLASDNIFSCGLLVSACFPFILNLIYKSININATFNSSRKIWENQYQDVIIGVTCLKFHIICQVINSDTNVRFEMQSRNSQFLYKFLPRKYFQR